jgi:hypothetical protein
MRIELKYKDVFEGVWKALNGIVGGRYEVKPNVWVECPTDLTWKLRKDGNDILVEFPKSRLKVSASKWMFQLDGSISLIRIKKDRLFILVDNMPDLEVIFI